MNFQIVYTEDYSDICAVHDPLYEFNLTKTGKARQEGVFAKKFDSSSAYVVRGDDGKVYGGVVWHLTENDDQTASVDYMYLDAALRGSGKGKELFATMEKHLKAAGVKVVTVTTNSFQAPWFYPAIGYIEVGAKPEPLPNVPDNLHFSYRKEL